MKLAITALLEVVQQGGRNLEVAVLKKGHKKMRMLQVEEIEKYVAEIEKEKEAEAAKQKREKRGGAAKD